MSTLERARAFVTRSTLSAAMSILPLALAAVNADAAAVTLTPEAYTPEVTPTGLSYSAVTPFALTPVTVGDVAGQKLYGSANLFVPFLGGNSLGAQAAQNLFIAARGDASGTFTSDTVGVTWDFNLTELAVVVCGLECLADLTTPAPFSWTIDFVIFDARSSYARSVSGSGGDGNYAGSTTISGLSGVSPTRWLIRLSVDYFGTAGFNIDIPQNSVAIPGATQAIPEPATVALMGAGFAVLAFRRFRRA